MLFNQIGDLPNDGIPASRGLESTSPSARTNNNAPIKAKFLSKKCKSHKMLYATVYNLK